MNRAQFERAITDAERASLASARARLHQLRRCLGEVWVDAGLQRRMLELARRCDEALPEIPAHDLAIGDAWLLLVAEAGGAGTVARMRVARHRPSANLLEAFETSNAVMGLAAAAAQSRRFVPHEALGLRFELADQSVVRRVQGGSLGLSACVALVSSLTGMPPRSNVAGTARIDPATGKLLSVTHVEAKLRALREEWPHVDTVVLAGDQPLPTDLRGLSVIHASALREALEPFGLSLDSLPQPPIENLRARVGAFSSDDAVAHDLGQWMSRSIEALEIAQLLEAEEPDLAAHSRIWAALFASHAGRNDQAERILAQVTEAQLEEPEHRVMRAVVLASVRIDEDPRAAATLGADAVELAQALEGRNWREWHGKALGTHGRALMHAGEYKEAVPLLRKAYEHHRDHLRREAGRSACYLSCCLRLAGRPLAALEMAQLAHDSADIAAKVSTAASSTLAYADLEKARALEVLGRFEDAAVLLQRLVTTGASHRHYPRLGAHRTLARVFRAQGRLPEADDHRRLCWDVACDEGQGITARKLGLVAACEELDHAASTQREPMISSGEVEALASVLLGTASRAHTLKTWVY